MRPCLVDKKALDRKSIAFKTRQISRTAEIPGTLATILKAEAR